ncbi:hypothetical protein HY469_05305 [Candidatus Roizmanbacteria bacterium]|nr:hypothetical protein [Candidatus Roizmanbacteria bacterium]
MLKRILVIVIALSVGISGYFIYQSQLQSTVYAVGDLNVNWGVPEGDPIFVVTNFAPGETETRNVDITNNAGTARPVGIRGVLDSETTGFSSQLIIEIFEGATSLYGPTTLSQFFTDSAGPDGIALSTLGPGAFTTYDINVTFDAASGNPFQGANIQFDLKIGIAIPVPEECSQIAFSGDPIFGTDGNDRILGTAGNDLIFALEGNDRVLAHGGDDCIVGGPGNDELRGETGNDIIFGNDGDDLVVGAVGNDLLFGNEGNDTLRGENNNDHMEGGNGDDLMLGGNNNDVILGGSGNDMLRGESGNDELVGGADTDNANGHSGTDSCDAEVEVSCEL